MKAEKRGAKGGRGLTIRWIKMYNNKIYMIAKGLSCRAAGREGRINHHGGTDDGALMHRM